MAETLYARVRRLVSANINDIVDTLEKSQAEAVMKEAVREVDRAIDEVRAELGKAIGKQHHIHRTIELTEKKIAELVEKSAFAVKQNRDDLAEAAIARQVDLEAQIPALKSEAEAAHSEQMRLEEFVAALTGRKHDMEAELRAFEEASREAEAVAGSNSAVPEQRVNRAQSAFDRAMKGATGIGSNASTAGTAAKIAELDQMSRAQVIADRLANLKQSA